MVLNYFKKAVIFGDAHFGRSADSPVANQDNLDYLDWLIDRAKSWGAETCIFVGDWFHNRSSIGVTSFDYALEGLERLSNAGFDRIVILKGNHDIAHRRSRDVSSLNFVHHLPNITLIRDPVVIDDIALIPWLMDDEHAVPPTLKARYGFAHLETVGAMMNARIVCMGGQHAVEADSFKAQEHVFTGHFHQRQHLKNITYIGSIMPFDFSDANDSARGAMFLEWGRDPFFEAWPDQPLYHTSPLSRLLDNLDALRPRMTVRATVDIDLRYEEAEQIRELLIGNYGLRKIELINLISPEATPIDADSDLHTVDQIVIDGLRNIESAGMSNDRLITIFNGLHRV
jgi:DNA repair exonuclease SbcCD nuclease subunit